MADHVFFNSTLLALKRRRFLCVGLCCRHRPPSSGVLFCWSMLKFLSRLANKKPRKLSLYVVLSPRSKYRNGCISTEWPEVWGIIRKSLKNIGNNYSLFRSYKFRFSRNLKNRERWNVSGNFLASGQAWNSCTKVAKKLLILKCFCGTIRH